MLNYFNFKKIENEYLITNSFGCYEFLGPTQFEELLLNKKVTNKDLQLKLERDAFIYSVSNKAFVDENFNRMMSAKEYLLSPTQLHIFVVTNACNMQCKYCQAQSGEQTHIGLMTEEIARGAVDVALQSPTEHFQFEFQGGEPLLNFNIIKYIVNYSQDVCGEKKVDYSIVSNLTLLDEEMIEFIVSHNISISTSLDGNKIIHDSNRPYKDGRGTFDDVRRAIQKLQSRGVYVGALLTTTRECFSYWKEIIDTYKDLGLRSISLRPLTQLGCANQSWQEVGYDAEDFLDFYRNSFDYLMEINKNYRMTEGLATVFLRKILDGWGSNYMELRSPCGATLGQLAYYYDGDIFTCDEGRMVAEMGDKSFKLGNVFFDNYDSILDKDVCKGVCSASILESLPSCCDCVYQHYCGVCPILNYVLFGDVYEKTPNNYKCKINKGILDTIFSKLLERNPEHIKMFWRWIR